MEDPLRASLSPDLQIIETMRCDTDGIARRDLHLARMAATAARLGFAFTGEGADAALARVPQGQWRVRLTLSQGGFAVSWGALAPNPPAFRIALASERLWSGDPWLGVKTTRRALYDRTRASLPEGIDEMLFLNEHGALCEGAITNIFVETGGAMLTPPLRAGLLPGVLRGELLSRGRAREAALTPNHLSQATRLYVGNALRGLIPATLVDLGV